MTSFVDYLKLFWSKTNRFHRALLVLLIVELRILPSGKLGFYCKDPALSYPFTGDTITWKWLLAICLLVPLVVMLIVERQKETKDKENSKKRALRWYKEYVYGLILDLALIQLMKIAVGSPRPHFFDTCMPKEAATCQDSEYVSHYTCTKSYWTTQSDRSFPSGHTSLAVHAAFFLVYYLHKRLSPTKRSSLVGVVQAAFLATAVWCSASRMADHRHHWWDVLAGAALGFVILFYTTHFLCKNFECTTKSDASPEGSDTKVPLVNTIDT